MTSRVFGCGTALLLLLLARSAFAQAPAPDPAAVPATGRGVEYGVRFGPAFTSLTSVETFDATVVAAAPEPTLHFGGYAHINIRGALSFQPEVLFAAKGERIHDKDAQPTVSGSSTKAPQADRVVLVRYLEFPLLARLTKMTRADSSVYLIAGPALAIRRSAVIRQVADSGKHEDIGDQVSGTNFSLVYGGGFQHQRWLVDARFTKGLRNIAVGPGSASVKTSGFAVLMGVRF
ncbi:MAG TPA: outer membrane beta-barrel protein [Vicinamibacterales bacterium]|nr:outer membrane beta-barrel protein [Vicinamibacterales bacterium]